MEEATAAVAPLAGLGPDEYLLAASHGPYSAHKFASFDVHFIPKAEKVTDSRYSHLVFHRLPKPPPAAPKAAAAPKPDPVFPNRHAAREWHARGGADKAPEPPQEVVIYHRTYR